MTSSETWQAATMRNEIPAEEFRERVSRAQQECWRRGLDGLVVWSKGGGTLDHYANVMYLTNHYSMFPDITDQPPHWVGHSNAAAIVPADGELTLVTLDAPDEALVVADKVEVVTDLPAGVGAVIDAAGLKGRRIGLVGSRAISLERWRLLAAACPGVEWNVVDDLLASLRLIKSEAEIGVIREAARVGDAILGAMLDAIAPGVSESEVASAGYGMATRLGAGLLDLPAASGPDAEHFARGTAPSFTTRQLATGDTWHSDMYGSYHGYYFDFARSTTVGGAPEGQDREMIETAIAAVQAGIDSLRPGNTFGDAYRSAAEELKGTGIQMFFPSFGHCLGLGVESPWLTPDNPAVVEPNMYVAVEALITLPGIGGAVYEDNVLTTAGAPEVLSSVPVRPWE